MRTLKWIIALSICLPVATIFLAGCSKTNSTEELVIGALLPLTGEAASYGQDCREGMEIAVASAEKRFNRKISVIYEDTKADPKTAVSAFNKLINVNKCKNVIGDMFSSTTLAIAPMAQDAKVTLITPTAADENIPTTGDCIFSIYPSASSEGQFMAEKLSDADINKVVVLYQNQTATKAIADAFAAGIKKRGGNVLLVESIADEKSGYRSLLEKTAALNPTCIYISAYRDPVAILITMGREMGIHALYATQSTLYDEKALADYVNKLNGVMISGPYFDANNPDDSIRTFGEQYKARFNKAPSVWAAYGYDAADIMINAILIATKAGVPTKEKLANQVFNGVTGRTEIKPDRSIVKEMVLYTIENNKFIRK